MYLFCSVQTILYLNEIYLRNSKSTGSFATPNQRKALYRKVMQIVLKSKVTDFLNLNGSTAIARFGNHCWPLFILAVTRDISWKSSSNNTDTW